MNTAVEGVSRLPMQFHAAGNKSLIQLLNECGYTNNAESITVSDIETCLADHPDWCDAWIGYSQDRRTNCGWVISDESGSFVVYYYPNGKQRLKYQNKATACAAFAIRELKSLVK